MERNRSTRDFTDFQWKRRKRRTKENYFPPSFDPARYAYVKVRKKNDGEILSSVSNP